MTDAGARRELTRLRDEHSQAIKEVERLRAKLANSKIEITELEARLKLVQRDPQDWATTVKDAQSWFECSENEAEEWCDKPHRQALNWVNELRAARAELAELKQFVEAEGEQLDDAEDARRELAKLRTAASDYRAAQEAIHLWSAIVERTGDALVDLLERGNQ